MDVVIDTNILYDNYLGNSPRFGLLIEESQRGMLRIVVPRIVIQETARKYAQRAAEGVKSLNAARSELAKVGIDAQLADETVAHAPISASEYEERLMLRFRGVAHVAAYPNAQHEELVKRLLSGQRPFKTKGEGYRDALIWETVLALAADGPVALITGNWHDFAQSRDGQELHSDLAEDLQQRRIPKGRVSFYVSLRSFVEAHVEPARQVLAEVRQLLDTDTAFQQYVQGTIASVVDAELPYGTELPVDEFEIRPFENPTLAHLDLPPPSISVEDARMLDPEGPALLRMQFETRADIEAFLFKADFYAMSDEEMPEVLDYDWNDHYMHVLLQRPITISVAARYDPSQRGLSDIRVEETSVEFTRL